MRKRIGSEPFGRRAGIVVLILSLISAHSLLAQSGCKFSVRVADGSNTSCTPQSFRLALIVRNEETGMDGDVQPANYVWTVGGSTVYSGPSAYYDTPVLTTPVHYVVHYTLGDMGICYGTVDVSVEILAPAGSTPIVGNVICSYESAQLSYTKVPGLVYKWMYNSTELFNGSQMGSYGAVIISGNVLTTGILTSSVNGLRVEASNYCGQSETSAAITVNPRPSVSILDQAFCVQTTQVALTANPGGGEWSGLHVSSIGLFSPSTAGGGTRSVTYIYTDENECSSQVSKNIEVVDPSPPASTSFISEYGDADTLTLSHNINETFKWYEIPSNGTSVFTGTSYITPALTSHKTYYVSKVHLNIGCEGTLRSIVAVKVGPPNNYNYIIETIPLVEKKAIADLEPLSPNGKKVDITYFDGFGRTMQQVHWRSSPGLKDVVGPVSYDAAGRVAVNYLPYRAVSIDGWYKKDAIHRTQPSVGKQIDYYDDDNNVDIPKDTAPFSKVFYENSPLNRIQEQGAPGIDWQPGNGHAIKKEYLINKWNDVFLFRYNSIDETIYHVSDSLDSAAYYPTNSLFCNKTTDEEQHAVLEFVDMEGKTVCKKVQVAGDIYASTYYIYDDQGNLVFVLPPEAVKRMTDGN